MLKATELLKTVPCQIFPLKWKIRTWPLRDKVVMGYVSRGQRYNEAPASTITVANITVSGSNAGSNAEDKYPGSVAVNGEQTIFQKGSGTEKDPYIISSVDELKDLCRYCKRYRNHISESVHQIERRYRSTGYIR